MEIVGTVGDCGFHQGLVGDDDRDRLTFVDTRHGGVFAVGMSMSRFGSVEVVYGGGEGCGGREEEIWNDVAE